MKRWTAGLAVTAGTAGLLLAGAGPALADEDTSAPDVTSAVCDTRIPAVLARIDRMTARINGAGSTVGSTAWLRARADRARAAGLTATADLLDERAAARPERVEQLAELKSDVQAAQAEDCG